LDTRVFTDRDQERPSTLPVNCRFVPLQTSMYNRSSLLSGRYVRWLCRICCHLFSHGEYVDGTDGQTDAKPLHYAFRYGGGSVTTFGSKSVKKNCVK